MASQPSETRTAGVATLALTVFDLDADPAADLHTRGCDHHGTAGVEQLDNAWFEHLFELLIAHFLPEVNLALATEIETHPSQATARSKVNPSESSR